MSLHARIGLALILACSLIGCTRPSTEQLRGLTDDQVVALYGEPDKRIGGQVGGLQPFGPRPTGLLTGERWYAMNYHYSIPGSWYSVHLVPRAAYQRINGEDPGDADWYVLSVAYTPPGVIY